MDRNETIYLHNTVPQSRRDEDDSSQSSLTLIHPTLPVGGNTTQHKCVLVFPANLSLHLTAEKSNVTNINEQVKSFMPEQGEHCHHWSTSEDHEAEILFSQDARGNI